MKKVKWQVTCNENLGTFGGHYTVKGKEFEATLESNWFPGNDQPQVGMIVWGLVVWVDKDRYLTAFVDDLSDAIARVDEIYNDPDL